jgi:pimeloyl-ACP methyl ester carboxylesterase
LSEPTPIVADHGNALGSEPLTEQLQAVVFHARLIAIAIGRTVADPPKELAALFRPSVQGFLISEFKYDPAKEIAKLEMPVLIVQGTTDVQITVEDAKCLAAAKKDSKLVIIEGMNHTLKSASTQAEQSKAYFDPSLPLAPRLAEEIAAFLREALAKPH